MTFHPLTPAEPEPEPYRFQAWHGLVLVGVMTLSVPGIALMLDDDGPRVPVDTAGGTYAGLADTAAGGGGAEGVVDLTEAPSLAIYTIPVGVAITIDGQSAGVSPYRSGDLERRAYHVTLRADGYAPIDTVVHLDEYPRSLLAVDLVPDGSRPIPPAVEAPVRSPDEPPPAPAAPPTAPVDDRPSELTVSVIPWGSIYLDGQIVARETDVRQSFTLPPGRHTVAAEHPTLGRTETTVNLRPGASRSVTLELSP
jgi:hypothetical protein